MDPNEIQGRKHIGLLDLVGEPLNTVWGDLILRQREQDGCPMWKKEQDRRLVDLYLDPPKWCDNPDLWKQRREAIMGPDKKPGHERKVLPNSAEKLLSSPKASRRHASPKQDNRDGSRGTQRVLADETALSPQQIPSPKGQVGYLERAYLARANSAPIITKRPKASFEYGRPPQSQFLKYSMMHMRPIPVKERSLAEGETKLSRTFQRSQMLEHRSH